VPREAAFTIVKGRWYNMVRKLFIFIPAVLLLLLFCAAHSWAAAAPEPTDKTIPREIKIGKKTSEQVEKEIPRVHDPSREAKLAMITNKLTPYLQRDLQYYVKILEMKDPNAFSLPGGFTYITTGMLDFLKSDDEIAAILAHEFVHADRAHGIIQAARNNRLSLLTLAGMIAATQGGGMAAAMLSSAIQTAIMGAYSIELEKEADARGIDIMYKAGYNPAAMLTTMERLQVERMKRAYVDPGIFQTHPDVEERVKAALKYMKDNGIEVDRKDVVQRLKTEVSVKEGRAVLIIDGKTFVDLPEGDGSIKFLNELKGRLDDNLALELAPYDVTVHGDPGDQTLIIKGKVILSENEMPEEMPSIPEIRDRVITMLADARRDNPLADYYE